MRKRFTGTGKQYCSYTVFPPAHLSQTEFGQDMFSICVSNTDLGNSFHKKQSETKKIRIHPVSHADMYDFGLAWTLKILVRWGVFSLQSTVFCAGKRVGRSQTIKQCWGGRGKLWSFEGKGHNRALGQSCFSQQERSFLPGRKPVLLLSLECHCLLYTC